MKVALKGRSASSNFVQQKMVSWRPIFSPFIFLIIDIIIIILFLIFAILAHIYNNQIYDASIRYDNICNFSSDELCHVNLHVDKKIKGKINFYYKLTNFHQNQRRYVISRSDDQLAGEYVKFSDMEDCKPLRGIDDKEDNLILPCGLAAWTFFNDTYIFENTDLKFSDNEIAYKSNVNKLFKPLSNKYTSGIRYLENNPDFPGGQTNQHFIVWMRSSALPTLIKLYATCNDCTMDPGDYPISIKNNYPTDGFKGEKWILISKNSNFGTRNIFFEIACFVLCGIAVIALVIIVIIILVTPRKRGDKDLSARLIRGSHL